MLVLRGMQDDDGARRVHEADDKVLAGKGEGGRKGGWLAGWKERMGQREAPGWPVMTHSWAQRLLGPVIKKLVVRVHLFIFFAFPASRVYPFGVTRLSTNLHLPSISHSAPLQHTSVIFSSKEKRKSHSLACTHKKGPLNCLAATAVSLKCHSVSPAFPNRLVPLLP